MDDVTEAAYRQLIAEKVAARDGTAVPNASLAHASILIETMFKNAEASVRILTGKLNAQAYGSNGVIERARQFLADSSHSLTIIFSEPFDDSAVCRHPLLSALGPGSNVTLVQLNQKLGDGIPCHFATMDDDSYRYEADKTKPAAVAAFGDSKFTRNLNAIFEKLATLADRSTSLDQIKREMGALASSG